MWSVNQNTCLRVLQKELPPPPRAEMVRFYQNTNVLPVGICCSKCCLLCRSPCPQPGPAQGKRPHSDRGACRTTKTTSAAALFQVRFILNHTSDAEGRPPHSVCLLPAWRLMPSPQRKLSPWPRPLSALSSPLRQAQRPPGQALPSTAQS